MSHAAAVREVLESVDHGLTIAEMLARLSQQGHAVATKNPWKTLYGVLDTRADFVKLGHGKWGLAEKLGRVP